VALFGGALVVGGAGAAPAQAAPNPDVEISNITLTDYDGNPLTEQLEVGQEFVITGEWDATDADPQPGDTFTIGLPDVFDFVPGIPPINLVGDGETWAICDPVDGVLTCTFTEAVNGKDGIHGTFQFDARAVQATTEEQVTFDLNGVSGVVELPGEGGIDDGIDLPDEVSKTGVMNGNNWSMTWTVDIPGASLVAAGGDVAHITDTLGDGHQLCDPTGFIVQTVRGDTVVDVTELAEFDGTPGDTSFGIDLNAPEGGFDAGVTYRIKYQTCTPDGQIDPAGTTYDNSAEIEGWGEAGIGVGQVTNRPWHQNISKSGSVLGGTERNGKIRWTVTVPGSELVGKNSFTLAESLGSGHEVGADTISGITVHEQYGPSGDRRSEITDELERTINSQSGNAFNVTFAIENTEDFAFKTSDWRYIITYDTYVTSDELPEGGTQYANSASIDGKLTTGTAEVPGRKYDKAGKLNTAVKTLDGVEHSAFTTLDWTVTIPGEKIDGLDEIVLEDVLGDTHTVCTAGDPSDGVEARLGLNVSVQDQISGGGMTPDPANLTEFTEATVDGQTLTLKIGQPEDGEFSRDDQYVISYATCTASGGIDARGTEYTNQIEGSGVDRSGKTTMNYTGSGTGTGVAKGSIAVSKKITGAGAAFVPDGTTFDVLVKEFAPGSSEPENTYTLAVPLNGEAVSGHFQRGNGWTIELSEPTFPSVPGVSFGTPKFAEGDGIVLSENGSVATATISPQTNVALELTNEALLGQMQIAKVLEGTAATHPNALEQDFTFSAAIDVSGLGDNVPAQADRTFTLKGGESETLENLPIGAVVTVTEAQPADDDTLTWATPVVSPNPVTITTDHVATAAAVTVTNSVSRTVGTFSLSKLVTGAQADNSAVPAEVTVTASWQEEGGEPQTEQLTVPTDGTPVAFGHDLLIGTEVTLTETPLVDGSSIAWAAPGWSGTGVAAGEDNSAVVTIGRSADAAVVLENHAATSVAGLSLLKVLTGEAVADVPADAEFPVTATWEDAEGETQSRDLLINANEPTPLGVELPAGTVVTLTEGERPAIDTVEWGTITFDGTDVTDAGNGSATVVVSDQQDAVSLVSVTNEANWTAGTFSLSKQFDGILADDTDVPDTIEVTATWNITEGGELVPQSKTLVVPTDGSSVEFGEDLPAFTEVTLSEAQPAAGSRFTWLTPVWSADDHLVVHEDGTATLTVQPAGAHELLLTNGVLASVGSLELTKVVSGTGASMVAKDTAFEIVVEWTDLLGEQQQREVTVTPEESVAIDGFPVGTEVTLTEKPGKNPDGAEWVGAEWSAGAEGMTVDSDGRTATVTVSAEALASASLVLDNEYRDRGDVGGTGGERGNGLSTTGATMGGIIAGAVLLLGLGAAALVLQRRMRNRA
jgi:hypothetical protein